MTNAKDKVKKYGPWLAGFIVFLGIIALFR